MDSWLQEAVKDVQHSVREIEKTLAAQYATLTDHQRRSLANEEAVQLLRAEIRPLALHVAMVGAFAKVLAAAGTVVGIAVGIYKLLGH